MYLCGYNTKNMHIHTKTENTLRPIGGKKSFNYQDRKKSNDQAIQLSIHGRTQQNSCHGQKKHQDYHGNKVST